MGRRNASFRYFERNGRYYAEIYDPDRHPEQIQRTLRTTDESVARRKLVDWERDYADGKFDPWTEKRGQKLTVQEAIRDYRKHRADQDTPTTIRTRGSRFEQFLKWCPEGLPLKAVTPRHIEQFFDSIPGRFNDEPSIHTIETYYGTLSGFFSWAIEEGHLQEEDNPMNGVERPRAPSTDFTILDVRELGYVRSAILADTEPAPHGQSANRKRLRRYLLGVVDFAVTSMMRVGEICSIRWSQVRLRENEPTAYVRVENYNASAVEDGVDGFQAKTRTSTNRTVFLPPRGAYVLVQLRDAYRAEHEEDPPGDRIVFRSAWGKPLIPQTVSRLWAHYVRETQRIHRRVRFHDLRHTGISWALNDLGVPVSHVQEMAGHATADRTLSYKISGERSMRDAYLRLSGKEVQGETASHDEVRDFLWLEGKHADDDDVLLTFSPEYVELSKRETDRREVNEDDADTEEISVQVQ